MIDIQTLILALGIGNIGFALLMAGYTHGAVPNPGLKLFIWSRLVLGTSQLLGWMGPAPWLDGIGALGTVAGVALEVTSYIIFFAAKRYEQVLVSVSVLAFLLMLSAQLHGLSTIALVALSCVCVSVFAALSACILLRPRPSGNPLLRQIVGVSDALSAVAMAVGGWQVLQHPAQALGASPMHAYAAIGGYVLMIVNGYGFLLLCKQQTDDQMELLATTDFLTGLANRRAFFERAESARQLALRMHKPVALMMIDIDHFKQLNDRFGHATGDEALAAFAETALQAAERLRQSVIESPVVAEGAVYEMTVSIGVVLIDVREELTAALARADYALYAAKSGGRNRVEMGAPVLRRA